MWFSALKLGIKRGNAHLYAKKQETKMKMAEAQLAACRQTWLKEKLNTKANY